MISSRALLLFPLVAVACASRCSAKIHWGPCEDGEFKTDLPVQCGSIKVPYDYNTPNSTTFDLEIVKIPATTNQSRGSILHNFGGPGLEARHTLASVLGWELQQLSGGEYDLLAFDPRGTGKTIPFSCTDNAAAKNEMLLTSLIPTDSRENMGRVWARGRVNGNICAEDPNGVGEFVGTAFTARDFMSVVDSLGEDGMLRYWGFSYGTTLGATLASMFPDRIDKMIIDGVQNPHEYYNAFADFEEWTDTDEALRSLFRDCLAAGPQVCILAALGMSVDELEKATYEMFEDLRYDPIPVGTVVLDHFTVQANLAELLKAYPSWPDAAVILYALLQHDLVTLRAIIDYMLENAGPSENAFQAVESLWAIHCGDRAPRADTLAEVQPAFEKLVQTSKLIGPVIGWRSAICAQWPMEAKERAGGDFQVKTKNPVLVVGNTIDAHTPLRSAMNVSSGLEGSVVLEVNGTGHCAINLPSVCVAEQTMNYWANGTLPEPGTVCDVDALPFGTTSWEDIFEGMGLGRRVRRRGTTAQSHQGYFVKRNWL